MNFFQTKLNNIKSFFTNNKYSFVAGIAAFFSVGALAAVGGEAADGATSIEAFDTTYAVIVELAQGVVGKIVTALAVIWGFISIIQQNWIVVFGAFLGAFLLSNLEAVVDDVFGATVELAPVVTETVTQVTTALPIL
ncbi:MAG: hypothetical protein GJ680_07410 [Alteromonadaceae bacterium]|nr:hypothetical protein [Alteromonadaceae bacterium]